MIGRPKKKVEPVPQVQPAEESTEEVVDLRLLREENQLLRKKLELYQEQELLKNDEVYRYHLLRMLNQIELNLQPLAKLDSIDKKLFDLNTVMATSQGLEVEEGNEE